VNTLKNLCKAFEIKLVDENPRLNFGGELDEYPKNLGKSGGEKSVPKRNDATNLYQR
jgi:hypothetical protein